MKMEDRRSLLLHQNYRHLLTYKEWQKIKKIVFFPSHLREEGSLFSLLLQAVSHQSLHGLWTVAAHLAEVRRQVTSTHHKYDLQGIDVSLKYLYIGIIRLETFCGGLFSNSAQMLIYRMEESCHYNNVYSWIYRLTVLLLVC